MKNMQQVTESLVVANMNIRNAETFDDLESAHVEVDEAVTSLCQLIGLDKENLERFILSDGRKRNV